MKGYFNQIITKSTIKNGISSNVILKSPALTAKAIITTIETVLCILSKKMFLESVVTCLLKNKSPRNLGVIGENFKK